MCLSGSTWWRTSDSSFSRLVEGSCMNASSGVFILVRRLIGYTPVLTIVDVLGKADVLGRADVRFLQVPILSCIRSSWSKGMHIILHLWVFQLYCVRGSPISTVPPRSGTMPAGLVLEPGLSWPVKLKWS
ncbi:hypothetical protein GW17_00057159 [Ensete ventricosum]|nr:hypothetical protein GW17_00057159 [Ensete ventricosum]